AVRIPGKALHAEATRRRSEEDAGGVGTVIFRSFPRKRESSSYCKRLGPRFRGDELKITTSVRSVPAPARRSATRRRGRRVHNPSHCCSPSAGRNRQASESEE